jgi:hypothetical protein
MEINRQRSHTQSSSRKHVRQHQPERPDVEVHSRGAGFIFVQSDGQHPQKNTASRRSHVMQHYFRSRSDGASSTGHPRQQPQAATTNQMTFRLLRDRLETRKPRKAKRIPPRSTPEAITTAGPSSHQKRESETYQSLRTKTIAEDEEKGLLRLSTSPLLFFGHLKLDPFDSLPVKLNEWDERLLDRFSHYGKWPWCPVSGQSLWSPFAMSSRMVFAATMYSWCMAFRTRIKGKEPPAWLEQNTEVLKYKGLAISLINEGISNAARAVTDEIIASVAALANVELIFGTRATFAAHFSGLHSLVTLRGGFNTFTTPLQQLIQRLISWSDLVFAGLYQTSLRYPSTELWDIAWNTLDQISIPGSPICLAPSSLLLTGTSNNEAVDILSATRQLCFEEQRQPLLGLSEPERMLRADLCMSLEKRLINIIQSTAKPQKDYWNSAIWRSTALANIIFVHHFLRGVGLRSPQFAVWATSLRDSLALVHERTTLEELRFARSLQLWVLSVGAIASVGRKEHEWFVKWLEEVCCEHEMGWLDFLSILQGFMWTGEIDERRYREVWMEFGVANGEAGVL